MPGRKAQERALRVLLGEEADAPSAVYRPGERTGGRGRGGRGAGRGGRGGARTSKGEGSDGLVWATDEERRALRGCVQEVLAVVEDVRTQRGES